MTTHKLVEKNYTHCPMTGGRHPLFTEKHEAFIRHSRLDPRAKSFEITNVIRHATGGMRVEWRELVEGVQCTQYQEFPE